MRTLKIFLFIYLVIFFNSCNKEENTFYTGNIIGFVNLVDENGNELIDKSGVKVSLDNTKYSVISNDIGRFAFTDIPAGTYNLTFDKEGFGIFKRFSYQFIGGNVPALLYETKLYQQPTIEIQSLDIFLEDNIIKISGTLTEKSEYSVQFFVGFSSDVSDRNYHYKSWRYGISGFTSNSFGDNIYLSNTPFSHGDKVYIVVYFYNPYDLSGYYDYNLEEFFISSSKKASNIIEFIIQ